MMRRSAFSQCGAGVQQQITDLVAHAKQADHSLPAVVHALIEHWLGVEAALEHAPEKEDT